LTYLGVLGVFGNLVLIHISGKAFEGQLSGVWDFLICKGFTTILSL
jgi:hypothetical protein